MKILLLGTGPFALPIFQMAKAHFEVVGLVSQPDRPKGRGQKIQQGIVKKWALKEGIKIFQPEKIRTIFEDLQELDFDYILCASFGQFVPSKILALAKKYPLNVHGSILPRHRGASPIQYTLLKGDKVAGVSLMIMVKEMDAGGVVAEASLEVEKWDTADSLFIKLADLSAQHLVAWLNDFDKGKLKIVEQEHHLKTLSPKLQKNDAQFESEKWKAKELINHIRAYSSNPGAFTFYQGKRLKVFFATSNKDDIPQKWHKDPTIIELPCEDQKIYLLDYQFAGKARHNLLKVIFQ